MDLKNKMKNAFKRRSINIDHNIYESNSDTSHEEIDKEKRKETKIVEHLKRYYQSGESVTTDSNSYDWRYSHNKHNEIECSICENKNGKNENYIILSCNHVFHIYCLAEQQFNDIYNYAIIDNDYFKSRNCTVCNKMLLTEELMFLHTKFLNGTKGNIEEHDVKINTLEEKMKHLREELKISMDYKHKLESEREKSKKICATLMTMM
jgi:hypothetical protein